VAGQRAIRLTESRNGPFQPPPATLWVSARTHLPLRMIDNAGAGAIEQTNWRYLAPTAANMALLRVPVPRGYPRVR